VSSIGTYRSALSFYLPTIDGVMVGEHPTITRLLKGFKNERPQLPRYTNTWDSDLVINFLKDYDHGTLKSITMKLTMILALVTGQRAQTLSKLKLSEMVETQNGIIFRIGDHLKTKAPGTAVVELAKFNDNSAICPVNLITTYIEATKNVRTDDQLLISFAKPHKAVNVDTIRRWVMHVMSISGVDTDVFKPHSTRSASTSKANVKQVPLECILSAAMWTNGSTFAKFYNKPIVSQRGTCYQNAILDVKCTNK